MYKLRAPMDFVPPYEGSILGYKIDPEGFVTVEKDYERQYLKRFFFEDLEPVRPRNDIKKLLVVMQGGAGDTLFATPGLKALKEQRPEVEVTVTTWNIGLALIKDNPNIDHNLHTIASELAMHYKDFDDVINFGRVISYRPEAEEMNAYDIYSLHFEELFGIEVKDKIPEIFLTPEEKIAARKVLIDNGVKTVDKVIGIVDSSSNLVRSWPFQYSLDLAYKLAEAGYKVVMLGNDRTIENRRYFTCPYCQANQYIDINTPHHLQTTIKCPECKEVIFVSGDNHAPGIIWTIGQTSVRQAASLITQCDLVVGADSGLLHVAGALRVPILGLYGPFHSDLRIRYMENANAIQSEVPCGPCFNHNHHIYPCPLGGLNGKCMWNITPQEVFEKTINIVERGISYPPPPVHVPEVKPKTCPICGHEKPRFIFGKKNVRYYQCVKCSGVFSPDAPENDFERYQSRWEEFDDSIKQVLAAHAQEDIKYINEFLSEDMSEVRLLELGVGEAFYLNWMKNAGAEVYGVEASRIGIEKSIEQYGPWLKNKLFSLDFIKDDLSVLKDLKPNVIVATGFIEHFKDPNVLWEKMGEIIEKDGLIILSGPSSEFIVSWNEPACVNTEEAGQHKMFLSKKSLDFLCEKHGFKPKILDIMNDHQFYFVAKKT